MELQQQMPDRKLGGFLNFRQPGDYGRYVADNDPGGVASGFSNLEDFLAATPDYKNPVFDNLLKNDGTRAPGSIRIDDKRGIGGGLLGSAPGEDPFRIRSIEERKQIAEEMNNSGGGPMKNDGTRVPVTWEQVGDGRNTMPSMPIKPDGFNPPQGIGSLIPTPQQPGLGDLLGSGNENSFTPQQPVMPTSPYQEQLTGFGEQLTGFGNQLTGFNDQFGGFNDQFGGFNNQFKGLDKQFDMINTRLNSVDEGIASLSKQSQPQQQSYNSPYPNFNFRTNSYSNSSPFGLSSLFMGMY